jgi:cephalosporin-C deacetylase-like acetyl esterase
MSIFFIKWTKFASCLLPFSGFVVFPIPSLLPVSTLLFSVVMLSAAPLFADETSPQPERGTIRFEPLPNAQPGPESFALTSHEFPYELLPRTIDSDRFQAADVTFPSPVKTPHERNNTVHAEYYRPKQEGKRPAVIVLHILGGDFTLSRLFCHSLNQSGTAALFVKMPYYGPRREPGVRRRMIAEDPQETVEGMTQAVLDIRRAAAFLASRDEIDPEQIGILGVSLGGITAALAAEAEPRINNVCLLLAGGDFPRIAAESREFAKQREAFKRSGKDGDEFNRIIRQIDPLRYAELLKNRRMLMLNAKDDEVIPPACTHALWEAAGKPEIVWLDGGHYSVIRHLPAALHRANRFFEDKE